jgi:hypothetical protein
MDTLSDRLSAVPWLMIFDNVDGEESQEALETYIPRGDRGSILITSRDQKFRQDFEGAILPNLELESSVSLLLRLTERASRPAGTPGDLRTAALQLVQMVDYLPLGIQVIAKLVNRSSTSLVEFAKAYTARDIVEDSLDARPFKDVQSYPHTLLTVWKMSYDLLDGDQKTLLKVLAFLDPDRVQGELLEGGVGTVIKPKCSLLVRPRNLIRARMGLLQQSLVDENEGIGELRVHRLVQSFCQVQMGDLSETQEAFEIAFGLVENAFPITPVDQRHNKSYWTGQQAYISHVQSLARNYEQLETSVAVDPKRFCALMHNAAWYVQTSCLDG